MRCQARGAPGVCVNLRVFDPPFPILQHLPSNLFRLQAEPLTLVIVLYVQNAAAHAAIAEKIHAASRKNITRLLL
jgi:hypothetical protein